MKKVYIYQEEQFEQYKKEREKEGIEIVPISKMTRVTNEQELYDNNKEIDLTSLGMALENRQDLVFTLEPFFEKIDDRIKFLVSEKYLEIIKTSFKFDFEEFIMMENSKKKNTKEKMKKILKISDLTDTKIQDLLEEFNNKIYGHKKFKKDLGKAVRNFRILNKLNEQKILSIFIMGDSGVGKTEVATQLYYLLGGRESLCKISFANYSSKDSLNSLIGSPRGYIGSDNGELVSKVSKTDVGIILIDEFERADNKVHNFFLELLEKAKFSDSQGKDYDLNGYIIIFTSNMRDNEFRQTVLPELASRFDCICRFNQLSNEDKEMFLDSYTNNLLQKYNSLYKTKINRENLIKQMNEEVKIELYNNIRKLKRDIASKFIEIVNTVDKK